LNGWVVVVVVVVGVVIVIVVGGGGGGVWSNDMVRFGWRMDEEY